MQSKAQIDQVLHGMSDAEEISGVVAMAATEGCDLSGRVR